MRRLAALGLLAIVSGTASLCWCGHCLFQGTTCLGLNGVILQRGAYDCGAAALKMIFDQYGIPVAYDDLLAELRSTSKGASMLSLKRLAEAKGLRCSGWQLNLADLHHVPLPAILFLNGNHYAVLDAITATGESLLRDPARGRLRLSARRLQSIWKGEVLLFVRSR